MAHQYRDDFRFRLIERLESENFRVNKGEFAKERFLFALTISRRLFFLERFFRCVTTKLKQSRPITVLFEWLHARENTRSLTSAGKLVTAAQNGKVAIRVSFGSDSLRKKKYDVAHSL